MQIGALAKHSGLSADTLRYYEKQGLIPPPSRHPNGYRDYPAQTVQWLQFIHNAKAVGFSLKECRDLMRIFHARDQHCCADVKDLAETKLHQLAQQMQQLQQMHHTLKQIADACCGGEEAATFCSILDQLHQGATT